MTQPYPYRSQGRPQPEPEGYPEAQFYPPQAPNQPQAPQVRYESYPTAEVSPQPYNPAYQQYGGQPYGPAYQPYRPYAAPVPAVDPGRNLGIAGLIIALVGWILPYVGVLAPVLALVFGISALNQSKSVGIRNNVALAAAIVGGIEIGLGLLTLVGFVLFAVMAA